VFSTAVYRSGVERTKPSVQPVSEDLSLSVKRQEREANHPFLPSADINV
jgi:hypothetical protein